MEKGRAPQLLVLCCAAALAFSAGGASSQEKPGLLDTPQATTAQLAVLDRLQGTWDVTLTSRAPNPGTMTYTETYEWVLARQFLRGETAVKPDGTQDMSMVTYDAAMRCYRLLFFNSKGMAVELSPGLWDAKTQSMEWRSGPILDLSWTARWTFPDAKTRRSTIKVKDWRGKVLLDLEATAVRHK